MTGRTRSTRPFAIAVLLATSVGALSLAVPRHGTGASGQGRGDAAEGKNFLAGRAYSPDEDRALLKRFDGLRVADVSDGMDAVGLPDVGLMDPRIAPLWRDLEAFSHRFCGVALTVRYVPTNRRASPANLEDFKKFEGRWYRELSPEPFVGLLR